MEKNGSLNVTEALMPLSINKVTELVHLLSSACERDFKNALDYFFQ